MKMPTGSQSGEACRRCRVKKSRQVAHRRLSTEVWTAPPAATVEAPVPVGGAHAPDVAAGFEGPAARTRSPQERQFPALSPRPRISSKFFGGADQPASAGALACSDKDVQNLGRGTSSDGAAPDVVEQRTSSDHAAGVLEPPGCSRAVGSARRCSPKRRALAVEGQPQRCLGGTQPEGVGRGRPAPNRRSRGRCRRPQQGPTKNFRGSACQWRNVVSRTCRSRSALVEIRFLGSNKDAARRR